MAERIILYWRDIPTQVIVKAGRKSAKRELPERFIQAVDRCAMRVGARDTDSYLADWRRGAPAPCGEDLEQEAADALAGLESEYGAERLRKLVEDGGWESR